MSSEPLLFTFELAAAGAAVTLWKTVYFFIERVSLPKTRPRPLHAIYAARLAQYERNAAEVERLASDLIELSTRYSFAHWLAIGEVFRAWARSALGDTAEGISWIEDGIEDYRATGSIAWVPYFLELKAEALHAANRTAEALQALEEAEALAERSGGRHVCVELHRLRGVFLASIGANEVQIEACFREAIRIARKQKSISREKRSEATYAEYRRQKGTGRPALPSRASG